MNALGETRSHAVSLRFGDGVERTVAVDDGVPVLDAALAAGVPVLHQCRSGSCCSCAARLIGGTAAIQADGGGALLKSEREHGMRLLCRTTVTADCVFELEYDSATGSDRPRKAHAFIDALDRLTPDVVRLRLELAEDQWLDFRPGQFFQLRVPGTDLTRRYSPSSTPADLPQLELLIRLLPDGVMSAYLRERAAPDDVLEIEGPFGAFFLRDKVKAPHVMVAGGTGLAPILSMIDTIRRQPGRKPPMLLSFGCNTRDSLFHRDELELRRLWVPSLMARLSIDRGDPFEDVRIGTPVDAIDAADVRDEDTIAYLCGPPPMIEAARLHLQALGVRPDRIFAEQFLPSE